MAAGKGNYPDLRLTTESPTDQPPVDRSYPSGPGPPAPGPRCIVKRDGRRIQYGHPQFVASIRKAMLGRPHASDSAGLVAEWVLWGLRGQSWVHTSQLQVGVLDCLRRLDDIAHLRWAAVAKQMTTVTQVRDEARGLTINPPVASSSIPG